MGTLFMFNYKLLFKNVGRTGPRGALGSTVAALQRRLRLKEGRKEPRRLAGPLGRRLKGDGPGGAVRLARAPQKGILRAGREEVG